MSKFGELINAQVPVLIDFYTEWNDSSVSMHPVIRDVAAALGDKAKVIKIDVDKNQELAITPLKYTPSRATESGGLQPSHLA